MAQEIGRRPFLREVPKVRWFFDHPRYLRYMARELTCIFIGAYTLVLVVGLARLTEGRMAYEAFLAELKSPLGIAFQVVALAFAVYHSVTWFNLTPKALPVQIGAAFLPDWAVAGAHYAAWILLSAAALYFAGAF